MNNDNEEEEEEETTEETNWQNAFWALVRSQQADADGYTGGYRGTTPAPHGGAATVRPQDIIGGTGQCWCGLPLHHDWPGKDRGRKHPRNPLTGNRPDVEGATMSTTAQRTLRRRDLRAYHRSLQDWIMLMQDKGLRLRAGRNSIVVYPPDGTNAITVYARSSEAQYASLQRWQAQHVPDEGPIDVKKLAEVLNDPTEHPTEHPTKEESASESEQPELPLTEEEKDTVEELLEAAEWEPWKSRDHTEGTTPINWEYTTIEGQTVFRCIRCWDTDHRYVTFHRRSMGGHTRMWHTNRDALYTPETRAKAVETGRVNRISEDVTAAIELLAGAVGYDVTGGKEVEHIKGELNKAAAELSATTASLEEWKKRAEEAEAKLALMKEVFGT